MWLGSGVAVAVVQACSCSSTSTPNPRNFHKLQVQPLKKKKIDEVFAQTDEWDKIQITNDPTHIEVPDL